MKSTANELDHLIEEYSRTFSAIPEKEFSAKPSAEKWSKKEVVGHLIDSAQNNLRRFICGQYETMPPKIVYEQNLWVALNDYQQATSEEVISLWVLLNKRIVAVLEKMPASAYGRLADTGNTHTLQFLAEDYVKHLKHHINQVVPGAFDIRYPS